LERRTTYANCINRSTAFFVFFQIKFPVRFSPAHNGLFCFEQGGSSYALQFVLQPVF
jgi:hypothetical protein